jgi:extracellular elastinolytic metalloproteinase
MRGSLPVARSVRTATVFAGLLALVAPAPLNAYSSTFSHAGSQVAAHEHEAAGPQNFDVRWGLAAERAGKVSVDAARARAEARLAGRVPGLVVERDEVSTLPKIVTQSVPGSRLSARGPKDAEAAARGFLRANRDVYGLTAAEVDGLRVVGKGAPAGGATIVRFEQHVSGVRVFQGGVSVLMTPADHEVVSTSGVLYPDAGAGVRSKTTALDMRAALARAATDLTNRAFAAADFVATRVDTAGMTVFEFGPDRTNAESPIFGEGVRVEQVVFPVAAGETIPAYYVEVITQGEPAGSGPCYSYVVSAVDGAVLFRKNLVSSDTYFYRVFADGAPGTRNQPHDSPQGFVGSPHPTGVLDSYQAGNGTTSVVPIESLIAPTDPWLPSGASVTTGNNVDAYLDISGTDGFNSVDVRGAASSAGNFDYPFDHLVATTDPTLRQSKTTHLFYYNNWLHDVWYEKGFTESWFVAQTDNYGRHTTGANDSIKAEGEDRSGSNNANMLTPADGSRPRMQMYRFTGGGLLDPQRDSSHDWGIVAHEWMHYMSNRLVGNASGLNNNQGGSMGEGWGDWNGLIWSIREGDDLDGIYTTGAWSTHLFWSNYTNNYYFGIRRYPYSTRMDRFPLTFKDIGPGLVHPANVLRNTNIGAGSASEVHNAGEVWSNMVWEASVALMKTYGLAEGRNRILQYVCDGMKMTPSSPTFGQARQAIVDAANAVHPEDVPLLWQAFAKRGIGEGAVSPPSGSFNHSGITEAFVAPVALPNDTVGVFTAGNFFQRNVHLGGTADNTPFYGAPGLTPLVGNWNGGAAVGADSADTLGAYDPASGAFFLRNSNTPGAADMVFTFGPGGLGFVPLAGDWNGDGTTTIGLYDPVSGFFYLKNTNAGGGADVVFSFGPGGTFVPVVGDWNNDGIDTIGAYDPATGFFYLRNSNTPGAAEVVFGFGAGGALPITGDWNDDGVDTVGIYFPATGVYFLRNTNTAGAADKTIVFGPTGTGTPFAGNFDGQ